MLSRHSPMLEESSSEEESSSDSESDSAEQSSVEQGVQTQYFTPERIYSTPSNSQSISRVRIISSQPIEVPDSDSDSDHGGSKSDSESEVYSDEVDETDSEEDASEDDIPSVFPLVLKESPTRTAGGTSRTLALPPEEEAGTDREEPSLSRPTVSTRLGRAATLPTIGSSRASDPFLVQKENDVPAIPVAPVLSRARSDDQATPQRNAMPVRATKAHKDVPAGPILHLSSDGYAVIAHNDQAQELFDNYDLSWGVQYELARGVTKGWWHWSDVNQEKIKTLMGMKEREMMPAHVLDVMLGRKPGMSRPELWKELHREQLAIIDNDSRGLGLKGDWEGQHDWYGGKIQQLVRLVPEEQIGTDKQKGTLPTFHLQLEPMKIGRSHRFARFLGSRRVLNMKIPTLYDADWELLKKLLAQKFVLCGRIYVAFAVKESKLYLLETDEDYGRAAQVSQGDHYRMTLDELISWYNPMHLNHKQKVNKWAARFDLGLSTSIPILQLEPEDISIIDDLYAPHDGENVPTNKIYTDGCGFMNASALMVIGRKMSLPERPTAVQGRVLGSKGVWILHPEHTIPTGPPKVWIRKSQQKVHLVDTKEFTVAALKKLHHAHFIFDLVAPARVWKPSRLSKDTLINFEHNGVPKDVFVRLMDEGLRREVELLTQWKGDKAMVRLWDAINGNSGVSAQRIQRTADGMKRALGLTNNRKEDPDSDGEDEPPEEEADRDASSKTDAPPFSFAERVMDKLQAGFSPLEDRILYEDIRRILTETIKRYIQDCAIVMPQSAEAFIVPDPTGLLEPGQIQFVSSQYLKDPLEDSQPRILTGEVLIYRNPARVASDVQKVTAVCLPELAQYVDVIVVPVQGFESLPSMLAGGDVDGDTAVCVFDPALVGAFKPSRMVREPHGLMDNFEPLDKVPTIASVLLTGLAETRMGLYSMFHENAIYEFGYGHPKTVRNAFMFTTILDSRKSGLILRKDVLQKDRASFGWPKPECFGGVSDPQLVRHARKVRTPFILDELLEEGARLKDEKLAEYGRMGTGLEYRPDEDLKRPWKDALLLDIPGYKEELKILSAHVNECLKDWAVSVGDTAMNSRLAESKAKREARQKAGTKGKLDLAKKFAAGPVGCPLLRALGKLESVRASCAYTKNMSFGWAMAFQALCAIKASTKGTKAFTVEFAEVMSISSAAMRVISQDFLGLE
ncbi:hypothetical protein BDW22DRAFT_303425 [Trametopsis cervina]|nr:hypothetical protein BDW22DRAFT_303425 [Trametopsis cervina]